MGFSLEAIVFYLVFLDAIIATLIAWSGRGEAMNRKLGLISRFFPITRGWTLYYLILVLWIGYGLTRLGVV